MTLLHSELFLEAELNIVFHVGHDMQLMEGNVTIHRHQKLLNVGDPNYSFCEHTGGAHIVKTASSTDLAYRKSGSLVSKYVACE